MAIFRAFIAAALLFLPLSPVAMADVNVNTASSSQLESLPGIGPSKAAAIMQYRTDHGPFESLSQLDAVPGIGPATLENISPMVVFSAESTVSASASKKSSSPSVASANQVININTASQTDLTTLPGVGPSKAAAIIEYRQANGAFSACAELQRVRGIGDATVKNISPQCIVE